LVGTVKARRNIGGAAPSGVDGAVELAIMRASSGHRMFREHLTNDSRIAQRNTQFTLQLQMIAGGRGT